MRREYFNNNHLNTVSNLRSNMHEYLLVLSCDVITEAQVMGVKKYFEQHYGCANAANLTPHLTLFNCIIHERKVDNIFRGCEYVARTSSPFLMKLKGFDMFEQGTIYIDLEDKSSEQILGLVTKLKAKIDVHVKEWAPAEYKFCQEPHVTVARNMDEKQLKKAFKEWHNRTFNASSPISEIVLLRRSLRKGAKYEAIGRFPLMGIRSAQDVQEELFS